jgi:ligand-binding sensor domain-containing protein
MQKEILLAYTFLWCFISYSCHTTKTTSITAQNTTSISISPVLDTNPVISQVVRTMFQDSRGNIWFGTQNGAFLFDGKSLISIKDIKCNLGKPVTIKGIAEDEEGKIWLGHTGGVSSFDNGLITNYHEKDGLIHQDVWSIATDTKGNIWIGTIAGICVFDGHKFTPFTLPEGKIDSTRGISSTQIVHCILEDKAGTLWFCSNAGLFSYDHQTLTNVSKSVGISTNFIHSVFEDKKGLLWVSTKTHLYCLQEGKQIYSTQQNKIEVGKGIGSVAEDTEGNIWFVSNQHKLFIYDQMKLTEYQKTESNKGPVVFQIYQDQKNRLWFIGYGGAFRLEDNKFIAVGKNGPW